MTTAKELISRARALVAQSQYEDAIAILNEGMINGPPDDDEYQQSLQSALRGAQKAQLWNLPASSLARKMVAAFQAAHARQQHKATASVEDPKVEPLMVVAMKTKDELLVELNKLAAAAAVEEGDGTNRVLLDIVLHFVLDPAYLAALQGMGPVWEKAFPTPPSKSLQDDSIRLRVPNLFAKSIQVVAKKTQSTSNATAIKIVEEIIVPTTNDRINHSYYDRERRQMALFSLLDKEGDTQILFADLASICYAYACDNLNDNLQTSTKLLVMMEDPNTSDNNKTTTRRSLDYAQFDKFLLSLSSTWNIGPEDVLDDLVLKCAGGTTRSLSEEERKQITAIVDSNGKLDPLTYTRTKLLFELWDTNGDGDIDFSELLTGLRKYQQASSSSSNVRAANAKAEKIALMIMGHDEDRNQTLDPDEFAGAMVDYAKAAETDLHELIDFMCCVVGTRPAEDSVAFEKAYSEASLARKQRTSVAFRHSFTMISGIPDIDEMAILEEDEEEEEEED